MEAFLTRKERVSPSLRHTSSTPTAECRCLTRTDTHVLFQHPVFVRPNLLHLCVDVPYEPGASTSPSTLWDVVAVRSELQRLSACDSASVVSGGSLLLPLKDSAVIKVKHFYKSRLRAAAWFLMLSVFRIVTQVKGGKTPIFCLSHRTHTKTQGECFLKDTHPE